MVTFITRGKRADKGNIKVKITNRQIANSINTYQIYQQKLRQTTDKLKRELFYNGQQETEKVKRLRDEFKSDSERLSKFLDEVI